MAKGITGVGGSGNRFGRSAFGARQMFEAICADCGQKAEVPFRPTGDKPVYCRECFKKPEHAPGGNFERRDFTSRPPKPEPRLAPHYDSRFDEIKRQLDSINSKLDQLVGTGRQTSLSQAIVKATKPKTAKAAKKKTGSKKK